MIDFTRDECNLILLYSPGTRQGLREALVQMKGQLAEDETELRSLADSVLGKLSHMGDDDFKKLDLDLNF